MKRFLLALLVIPAACTTTDEIIIDRKGVDLASGAAVGGAIGAITDGSEGAAKGAGVGAVTGGAKGLSQGERDEVRVVKRCLAGRGYRVLN